MKIKPYKIGTNLLLCAISTIIFSNTCLSSDPCISGSPHVSYEKAFNDQEFGELASLVLILMNISGQPLQTTTVGDLANMIQLKRDKCTDVWGRTSTSRCEMPPFFYFEQDSNGNLTKWWDLATCSNKVILTTSFPFQP